MIWVAKLISTEDLLKRINEANKRIDSEDPAHSNKTIIGLDAFGLYTSLTDGETLNAIKTQYFSNNSDHKPLKLYGISKVSCG